MKSLFVPCSRCGGCGSVELTGEHVATLARLGKGETNAATLARLMGVQATAMSNRLARLEDMGFLTSRRFGKKRLFRVKKVPS